MFDWKTFNPEVIEEFRANAGHVARFGGLPVVILHTIGARTGRVREIPLITILDGDEKLLFATAAGSPTNPDWYFNLKAHPRIEVETASERFMADVIELTGAAARDRVDEQERSVPQFADYVKSAAPRKIPVFSIARV
jgi:deazaflavin-dependent oxidoreductase (nitroreductase family)